MTYKEKQIMINELILDLLKKDYNAKILVQKLCQILVKPKFIHQYCNEFSKYSWYYDTPSFEFELMNAIKIYLNIDDDHKYVGAKTLREYHIDEFIMMLDRTFFTRQFNSISRHLGKLNSGIKFNY